jgi:PPK2 family polyphosphate:nucleotide phosphotransferase
MLTALIFDLDGVIVDSEPMHFESDKRTFRDYGLEIADEDLEPYVGIPGAKMWADFIERFGLPDTVEAIAARQMAHKAELLREWPLDAIPGVRELLAEAGRRGLFTAVASSSPREFVRAMLDSLKIADRFDAVVTGDEVPRGKPDPGIFLKAAKLLGARPGECLVIEDASAGVEAAKAAGMLCVGFRNPNSGNQDLSGADLVVTDIRQIVLADFMGRKKDRKARPIDIGEFRYDGDRKLELAKLKPGDTNGYESKSEAAARLRENIARMIEEQGKLYAQGRYALLIILQAMDAAGKDSAISHIMSGLNPQGTEVFSFKQPTSEDLSHDYLWRASRRLPERGRIGIFNRSYYEEVLVVRVHGLIGAERIPPEFTDNIWEKRYRQIRHYEEYLRENGVIPLKFFLHMSKEKQRARLLERIEDKSKNWKFSEADIQERRYWDDYQRCYEEMINATGTRHSPWYVVPSDRKWFSRLVISEAVVQALKALDIDYPELSREQQALLEKYRRVLEEDENI